MREIEEFMPYFMTPKIALSSHKEGVMDLVPCSPITVVCLLERGLTGWVMTECSAPVSTMRSTGCPVFIQTTGSWGPSRMEACLS
jgi:hypothetical protein